MCHQASYHARPGFYVVRRFPTVAEKKARLEAYAEELDNELKGVRERLERLSSE